MSLPSHVVMTVRTVVSWCINCSVFDCVLLCGASVFTSQHNTHNTWQNYCCRQIFSNWFIQYLIQYFRGKILKVDTKKILEYYGSEMSTEINAIKIQIIIADERKSEKHPGLPPGHMLALGPRLMAFLKELGCRIRAETDEPKSTEYMLPFICCCSVWEQYLCPGQHWRLTFILLKLKNNIITDFYSAAASGPTSHPNQP